MTDSSITAAPDDPGRLGQIIAQNLHRIRTARGIPLSRLARESGVARATLYQLEAGGSNPTIDTLFTLASALGVALGDLVTDVDPPLVQVIRAGEGPAIDGAAVEARLLRRLSSEGSTMELYDLLIWHGRVTTGHSHTTGVYEHVLLTQGRVRTGPVDDPVELEVGDYICFRADREHMYEAIGADARATLLMQYPAIGSLAQLAGE